MLHSPSNLWCSQLVSVTNTNKNIFWLKKNATSASSAKEVSLWAQPTLFKSVLPSTCIIAVLTFSTGSSESKGLKRSWKGSAGSAHHAWSMMESPQISAAPAGLPLATLSQSAQGAWKTRDLTLSHLHIPVIFCLTYVHVQYPDKLEGRLQPFHLHSLLC